jgi:outer membrane receptor protein involved in Fe transport
MAANPEFETETSWTYDLGLLKELWFDTKFRAATYYTEITDYQQHNYVRGVPETAIVYNIDVELYGIELELTRSFTHDLSGHLSYTWQNWSADDTPFDVEETHYLMQNLPRNKVTLGLNYKLWEGGVVTLNSQYMDERESKKERILDEVITVNVGAQHTFNLTYCDFTLRGYVNNVTDQEYEMRAGYPMPGMTAGICGKLSF